LEGTGRYTANLFSRDTFLEKSMAFLTRAIDLPPAYAGVFRDLSRTYFYLGVFGIDPPKEILSKAIKALELDETAVSAHVAFAAVHTFYDWDWAAAEAEFKRAVKVKPGRRINSAMPQGSGN